MWLCLAFLRHRSHSIAPPGAGGSSVCNQQASLPLPGADGAQESWLRQSGRPAGFRTRQSVPYPCHAVTSTSGEMLSRTVLQMRCLKGMRQAPPSSWERGLHITQNRSRHDRPLADSYHHRIIFSPDSARDLCPPPPTRVPRITLLCHSTSFLAFHLLQAVLISSAFSWIKNKIGPTTLHLTPHSVNICFYCCPFKEKDRKLSLY